MRAMLIAIASPIAAHNPIAVVVDVVRRISWWCTPPLVKRSLRNRGHSAKPAVDLAETISRATLRGWLFTLTGVRALP